MRDVESLCMEAGLGQVSKSTASRICNELRERFAAFMARELSAIRLVALFLDAIYLPVRPSGVKEGVLCAWGISQDGEHGHTRPKLARENLGPLSIRGRFVRRMVEHIVSRIRRQDMSDVVVKRIEEFDSPNGGGFCRARAGLGVTSFGLQVENFPPHFEHFPEHDHRADGQEEVYMALSGSATLHADGQSYRLEPGVLARVGPGVTRKITTGDDPIQLLAIGATPGAPYSPPAFTEEGAPLPG